MRFREICNTTVYPLEQSGAIALFFKERCDVNGALPFLKRKSAVPSKRIFSLDNQLKNLKCIKNKI